MRVCVCVFMHEHVRMQRCVCASTVTSGSKRARAEPGLLKLVPS